MIERDQIENIIVEVKNYYDLLPKLEFLNKMLDKGFKIYEYYEKYQVPVTAYAGIGHCL